MALYMDIHILPGVTSDSAAEAHVKDLQTQGRHNVKYLCYWVDEQQGKVSCLVEAPNAEAANAVHREAHGLVADEIFEVREGSSRLEQLAAKSGGVAPGNSLDEANKMRSLRTLSKIAAMLAPL